MKVSQRSGLLLCAPLALELNRRERARCWLDAAAASSKKRPSCW